MANKCRKCGKQLIVPSWKLCNECYKYQKGKRMHVESEKETPLYAESIKVLYMNSLREAERNLLDDSARLFTKVTLQSFPQVHS